MASSSDSESSTQAAPAGLWASFVRTLHEQQIISFLIVFFAVLVTLDYGHDVYSQYDTAPAVILTPAGIALAAVYLGGYRMWLPIAFAYFLGELATPLPEFVALAAALAYTMQAVLGAYIFKRFDFRGTMARTRGALVFIGTAVTLPSLGPGITVLAMSLGGVLPSPSITLWIEKWAGGVLSIMVFTPLITTWYLRERFSRTRKQTLETIAALAALIVGTFLTFWTLLPEFNMFFVLYVLLIILFWIALRMPPRIVATAIFLTAAIAMEGGIVAHPSQTPVDQQLLSNEFLIVLIAPIFYVLSSLVEERKENAEESQERALALEAANKRLSLEDQSKNEFLATLAHELRNPLAPIVSSLERVAIKAGELKRPDIAQIAATAQTHSRTLAKLLDDLLDISRISRKKFRLQKEVVEVHSIVEQAHSTVDALYRSFGHTLVIEMPSQELWIEADPLRLEQVIVNVLNNAARYTEAGGRVSLRIERGETGLTMTFTDNGRGIDPKVIGQIFEPFMQADTGSGKPSGGLGIGLALTKRLVDLHGGAIRVYSDGIGKGSTFTITLPMPKQDPLPLHEPTRRKKQTRLKKPLPRKILLVDDNKDAADGLAALLRHKGHKVAIAHTGKDALASSVAFDPEVVLLDIGLPDMSGYDVAALLRREQGDKTLLLVALTGYGQAEDKLKAQGAGFDHHLTKPVGIADVEVVLAKRSFRSAKSA